MVFIDGNNFREAVNEFFQCTYNINYFKLANLLAEKCNGDLQRFYYYIAQGDSKEDPEKFHKTEKFINAINSHPYSTVKKGFLRKIGQDLTGKNLYVEKGTDVHIAVDMISLAYHNAYDQAIIVSKVILHLWWTWAL
jgi:uncharacterized LabA/DUF88 family protein